MGNQINLTKEKKVARNLYKSKYRRSGKRAGQRHEKRCSDSCNGNRIAVNTDGKFYPCIQFVGDSRFEIGNYKTGIDIEKRKAILIKRLTSKVVCDECSLKERCIYKCGCARIMTTNDIVEVSPIICETERIYIEEADILANKLYKDFKEEFILLNYKK